MEFQSFWAEMWARCGPANMGFEQCEAARDVFEKAKAQIEAAERERCAKLCEAVGPVLCDSYGDSAECIATADACAAAIRGA